MYPPPNSASIHPTHPAHTHTHTKQQKNWPDKQMHGPESTSCLAEITSPPRPCRKRNPCLWRCHLAVCASAADTQAAAGARIVLLKMSARHIGSRRDTNRFPERKSREPKWRRASFAKPLLINRVSGENYMIWFLLLHHSAAANDIQGSSSTRHTPAQCCVWHWQRTVLRYNGILFLNLSVI